MKWLGICLLAAWLVPHSGSQGAESDSSGPTGITSQYFQTLRSGDAKQLREALERGSPVNGRDAAGNTPLMLVAVYGDVACIQLLLERGAQVNVTNAAGATPLMRAAHDYEKLRLLVARGADINARSVFGNTALMLAARPCNSHRSVELLVAHGADVNAASDSGATALMAAAAGSDKLSLKELLRHGANPNAQPGMDQRAFILGGGRSALMWAAYRGDLDMIKLLVDAGADVNAEGFMGTPLAQTAWNDQTAAARLLLDRGGRINQMSHRDGYTALHWAASTEASDCSLVKLLLKRGADPNVGGGENVDAFMDVLQTPLMLARKRGDTAVLATLRAAGATNETPDRITLSSPPERHLPERLDSATIRAAISQAIPLLQETSLLSKQAFVQHASHQDCVSCHQQFLPLAALGVARKQVTIDEQSERELINLVAPGELKNPEIDWEALFHPEPAYTKGYGLFGLAAVDFPASETTDSWVHHLTVIQAADGRWCNNLPRPPIQANDIGATALAIHAMQRYPLPGRRAEFTERVARASRWLRGVKAEDNNGRALQLLGLAWAGEPSKERAGLAKALLAQQRSDGGWAQLPGLHTDAYATGEALYALQVGGGISLSNTAIQRGRRFLLSTQLADGTWHVHRRAFPVQPTMKSGFPHGRDSWLSAAATSWAVLALSLPAETEVAGNR